MKNFKVSNGWYTRFCDRYNLTKRKRNEKKAFSFAKFDSKLRRWMVGLGKFPSPKSQEIPEEEEKSCAQKKKAGKKRGGAKRSRSGQKKGEIDVELESEGEADEDIQSHPASSSVFSDDDSNSDIDMDVRDMTSEELYSPFLFFDRPVQDNYRARVADEYSRLVCEAKRAGRNTNSTRVIDELELLANKNVTDSDNQAKQVAVGGRPVRQAARQALGHDFYSELHYFGQ